MTTFSAPACTPPPTPPPNSSKSKPQEDDTIVVDLNELVRRVTESAMRDAFEKLFVDVEECLSPEQAAQAEPPALSKELEEYRAEIHKVSNSIGEGLRALEAQVQRHTSALNAQLEHCNATLQEIAYAPSTEMHGAHGGGH